MIVAVSLRLLYLIFQHLLGLLLPTGRTSRTKDIELLVLVVERLPDVSRPTLDLSETATRPPGPRLLDAALSRANTHGPTRSTRPARCCSTAMLTTGFDPCWQERQGG